MMTEPSQTLSEVLGTVEECRVEEERVQWLGHEGVARTAWTGQTSQIKYDYWLPSAATIIEETYARLFGTMLWPNLRAAVAKALDTAASIEEL